METNQATMQNLLNEAAAQQPPVQQAVQEPQPQQEPIELQLRAHELIAQARTIQAVARVDVLALYNTDAEVRQKVLSGEWDFIDVWKTLQPAPTPPAPVRTANGGAGASAMNIGAMNDQQFTKLNELLKKGVKVDMTY